MLFSKPLFTFVVAFTAVSGVVASTIPVARGGGKYPPPSPAPTNSCSGPQTVCCNTWTNSQNPSLGLLNILGSVLDGNLIDGLNCASVLGGNCNTQQLCCQNVEQNALVGINCVPINVNV